MSRVFTRKFTLSFVAQRNCLVASSEIGGGCRCLRCCKLLLQVAINKVLYYAHSHLAAHPTTAAAAAAASTTVACPPPLPPPSSFWGHSTIIAHCAEKLLFATSHSHDFQSRSILIENTFKCNATKCCNIVCGKN